MYQKMEICSHELNPVGSDNAKYMQGSEFKFWSPQEITFI